ncbi:MAG: hypothetical protein C4581_13985 [Nitrospiraceae bacterium]|nr:MAG: hypothetical protein C4581_13985 [Nitrospiraceae bacterium]
MQQAEECNEEISLLDYISIIARHMKLIIITVAIAVTATAIISFFSPKIYEAKAVIMPVSQSQEHTGMSAVALQFGLTSNQPSNTSELFSLLQSNILMERVIIKNNLVSLFFGEEARGKKENEQIWDGIRYLKSTIYKVRDNKREGIIELSAEYKDPEISAGILTSVLTELTDYMSSEAKRVADTNKEYLQSLIDKNSDPLIKQKIYGLIARQIEISMMAEVKENFAFKILDPPRIPDRKIRPRIAMNIMLSFIISLAGGIGMAFMVEHFKKRNKAGAPPGH